MSRPATNTGDLEFWAIDRRKQAVAVEAPLADANHMERKQNMSSPSPVTDGQHVWAMTGVGILKAFDFEGNEVWSRNIQTDYGRFGLNWGYASSPLLRDNALYVQVLHGMKTDDPSYLLKIDKMTRQDVVAGRASHERHARVAGLLHDAGLGRSERPRRARSSLAVTSCPATIRKRAVSIWRADVLNPQTDGNYRIVASPTIADGLIIAPTRNNPLVAMRPGGNGDVAGSHVVWTFAQGPMCPRRSATGRSSTWCVTMAWCLRST